MEGGTATRDELIAGTERGVLVTRFWYIRPLDPQTILVTGLTRDGLFLIEKGKVTRAVKNMRWNESPIVAFNNIEAMTRGRARGQRRRDRRRRPVAGLPGGPHPRVHVLERVRRGRERRRRRDPGQDLRAASSSRLRVGDVESTAGTPGRCGRRCAPLPPCGRRARRRVRAASARCRPGSARSVSRLSSV